MTLREAAAKAAFEQMMSIMRARYPAGENERLIIDETWETTSDQCRADWLMAIDAALEPLMHPTLPMIVAGNEAIGQQVTAEKVLGAMIAAAKSNT